MQSHAASSSATKPGMPQGTFAGVEGNLKSTKDDTRPFARITYDGLLNRAFETDVDFERLNTDLCRPLPPKANSKAWPIVAPSPEVFGAVAGWRVEQTQTPYEGSGSASEEPIRDRNVYEPYRWMFSPLHERAIALADRADDVVSALTHCNKDHVNGMVFGRICPEVDATRINKASVMLELQEGSAGAGNSSGRLTLDLRETENYSVFSGQIVGVKGPSLREGVMNVTDIAFRAPPAPVRIKRDNAMALHGLRSNSGPCKVFVACGPYTSNADLTFDPLAILLSEAVEQKADVLILTGPFVDSEHEMVRSGLPVAKDEVSGQVDEWSFQDVWKEFVLGLVDAALTNHRGLTIVFQPGVNDILCEPVYPQWPFPADAFATLEPEQRSRVVSLPNPATYVVADMLWGMTNADPIFGINVDDATSFTNPADKALDRYSQLARHLIDQRSYYPLFPSAMPAPNPKLQGLAADVDQAQRSVPLEVTKMWNLGLPACPDVLILPSKLGFPQAKAVGEHTVVINPGQLATKRSFAKVLVYPDHDIATSAFEGQEYVTNRAPHRVRVDIEKLDGPTSGTATTGAASQAAAASQAGGRPSYGTAGGAAGRASYGGTSQPGAGASGGFSASTQKK